MNHFGKGHKVRLFAADSLEFDFHSIAPIDFAFIDGAHDYQHVLSDSLKVYDILSPGGVMVWHDYGSATPWVEVREALERVPFAEEIVHVEGTQIAFLQKSVVSGPPSLHIAGKTPAGSDATDVRESSCAAKVFCHGARTFGKTLRITLTGGFAAVHSLALINREMRPADRARF